MRRPGLHNARRRSRRGLVEGRCCLTRSVSMQSTRRAGRERPSACPPPRRVLDDRGEVAPRAWATRVAGRGRRWRTCVGITRTSRCRQ
eukprot:5221129-Pleurochrysis_carterae.AAC.1